MKESWDSHIRRAEELASERSEVKELLTFYGKLLGVQKQVYEYFRSREGWLPSGSLAQDLGIVRLMLSSLLEAAKQSLADRNRNADQQGHPRNDRFDK